MSTDDAIPTLDASRLHDPIMRRALDEACRDWGCFQLVRHGIEAGLLQALQREMRAFFALPIEVKRRVERTAENPWGFYDRELTKNTRDWKQIFDCGPEGEDALPTPWLEERPMLRPVLRAHAEACRQLASKLLGAIAACLDWPAKDLMRAFLPRHTSFLRLNYYPPCPTPAQPVGVHTPAQGHLGVNHHTDAGALTLLLQDDQPGLEVFRAQRWHEVEVRPDALVVNLGDIVQVWSNDRYAAPVHRVRVDRSRPRYSAPFFLNPAPETLYAPLPTTIDAQAPPRFRPIRWSEFRALRAAGDYADRGEEVQIDHYRIDSPAREPLSSRGETHHGLH